MIKRTSTKWTRNFGDVGFAMVRRTLALMVVLSTTVCVAVGAQPRTGTAEALYGDAVAKEKAVRDALSVRTDAPAILRALHRVVADYETVVRRYPRSGYCDNALWNAAHLLADGYDRFGDDNDRAKAVRLIKMLASEYPHSRYAADASAVIAGFEQLRVAVPDDQDAIPAIRSIRRTVIDDAVRVTIELDAEVAFYEERLADPDRVFVDLSPTRIDPDLLGQTLRFDDDANLIRQIRIGRHPDDTIRVVLETVDVGSYSIYALYDPYRLVIECEPGRREAKQVVPDTPSTFGAPPPLQARDIGVLGPLDWSFPHSVTAESFAQARRSRSEALASTSVEPLPSLVTAMPIVPPSTNLAGGFSISRQLGLSVSRIVIDPGHGGHDPGAKTRGLTEADLVLDVALRLEKLLTTVPGVEVILTRRTNTFVGLEDRTAIANRHDADLFLSIHANASRNTKANGVETYFLNFATNLDAAAVAARENAASGEAMGALPDFVKSIALNNKLDESRDLATYVQKAMIETLKDTNVSVKDLGVKQAPFVVLIGAAMPSVLAEVSFLSNAQEARLLRGTEYRQSIAQALFSAVQRYQTSLTTGGEVAQN